MHQVSNNKTYNFYPYHLSALGSNICVPGATQTYCGPAELRGSGLKRTRRRGLDVRAPLSLRQKENYLTFLIAHSSITRAMSRLFFSIITMWPLPWMPLS